MSPGLLQKSCQAVPSLENRHQKFLFHPQLCLPASPGFQIYLRVFSFGLGWVWSVYFLPCESDKPLGRMSGCLEALGRNLASA